jgi:hypothetical protein
MHGAWMIGQIFLTRSEQRFTRLRRTILERKKDGVNQPGSGMVRHGKSVPCDVAPD